MTSLVVPVTHADHVQGDPNAKVTLVEYGDYECPSCALAVPLVKALQGHFDDRLRFVFRNFPLTEIHREAESAAETAELAATHGRFWQMHDALYQNQDALGLPLYIALVEALNMERKDLTDTLESHAFVSKIHADFRGGLVSGVNGTPTFFINGYRYDGPVDFDNLAAAIELET